MACSKKSAVSISQHQPGLEKKIGAVMGSKWYEFVQLTLDGNTIFVGIKNAAAHLVKRLDRAIQAFARSIGGTYDPKNRRVAM